MNTYLQAFNQIPGWLYFVIGALFGGCIASFLGVVGERVPRGETLGGRSHCICGKPLAATANIPVLGWVLSRGRARCCGSRIPSRYVIGEASLAIVWGLSAALAASWAIAGVLMVVSASVALAASWVRSPADSHE